jgi:4-hydroxybenzoate polyprenyltransferase
MLIRQYQSPTERTSNMERLARVPRAWLTIAVVVAGIIGLLFGKQNHWSPIESFIYTILLALGCLMLTVGIYNRTHPDKPR